MEKGYFREAGVVEYELSVDDDNTAAIAFYEKLGFALVGRYAEFGAQQPVLLLEVEKTLVEGAAAACLAALVAHRARFEGRRVGLVLSGGNIDPLLLAGIIERGLVRTGRLTRITVEIADRPGALAEVTECLASLNANIEEIAHQRAFTSLPVQSVEVDFVLQTHSHAHVREVIDTLADLLALSSGAEGGGEYTSGGALIFDRMRDVAHLSADGRRRVELPSTAPSLVEFHRAPTDSRHLGCGLKFRAKARYVEPIHRPESTVRRSPFCR